MRLAQVTRQSFVGIDLLGQELGPAPLPLALPVFWSGKFFWRHIWVLFEHSYRIKLNLRFRSVRANSQGATALAVCELVFAVIFNDVVHFSAVSTCIYKIQTNECSREPCFSEASAK